jgi:hypothetical protein
MPDARASLLDSGVELGAALEATAARMPSRSVATLGRCVKRLDVMRKRLVTVEAPDEVRPEIRAMGTALEGLSAAVTVFAHEVGTAEPGVDVVPSAADVAVAYDGYLEQREALSAAIDARL